MYASSKRLRPHRRYFFLGSAGEDFGENACLRSMPKPLRVIPFFCGFVLEEVPFTTGLGVGGCDEDIRRKVTTKEKSLPERFKHRPQKLLLPLLQFPFSSPTMLAWP
jgi:hypothetical protein